MSKTKIPWADETWPVVTGCSHSGTPGCDSCYAARMAATRLKHHPRYEGLATIKNGKARWTGEVRLNHDVLEQPLHWKKPRRVFIASMADLFHKSVSFGFIGKVFAIMIAADWHTFQILTKRPERMLAFISWFQAKTALSLRSFRHIWLGVSVENQAAADKRIPWLLQTPAAVRFVSYEPALGPIDLRCLVWLDDRYYTPLSGKQFPMPMSVNNAPQNGPKIDWVIVGGESGPDARPMHPGWARSLRDQCQAAGVPFFFKQWGAWAPCYEASEGWLCLTHQDGNEITTRISNSVPLLENQWDETLIARVGKKRAGHLLDGRTWQQFPVANSAGNR